ncbi:lipopolysaccharide biosynthesis protein [Nocardioides limicola]|uniref:lipopolysaccharide biosynthesis protein n=1 Tax=Nocardioides limicola TaxID=2803368 RepID=UPI00193C05B3|nr:oligosaccharide flippase family protein [Nocardioides sp. DJM-14]
MTASPTFRSLLRSGTVVALAVGVMNVTTYGFVLAAARLLGPEEYGVVASLMGLLLIAGVLSIGLQATSARRVAAHPERRDQESQLLSVTRTVALGLGALCLILVPLVQWLLGLPTPAPALLVAITVVPLTLMGGQAGILQGERRWLPLAWIYLSFGLGRLLIGAVAMLWSPTATAALLGVAIGACLPALVGGMMLRRRPVHHDVPPRMAGERGELIREVAGNSHALLAFFVLANVDVILARALFDPQQAGIYAAGLILSKAVLFLPQFVVVIVFPALASAQTGRVHLKSQMVIAGAGGAVMAASWLLSGLAVQFIGGAQYAAVRDWLWLFALTGTLLAMLQLAVHASVARQRRRSAPLSWAGVVGLVLLGWWAEDGRALVLTVAVILGVVLVANLTLATRRGQAE